MSHAALWTAGRILFGLAVFVLGLAVLRFGLRTVWSARTERLLARLVRTPARGLCTGIGATVLTQSSAAVTVMSMALVGAGALRFADTVGIVLGTNIGSTFTVGLLTLGPERLAPYLIAGGAAAFAGAHLFAPAALRRRARALAVSAAGFGTLFIGFAAIEGALAPLASSPAALHWLLMAKAHPIAGVLAGTAVTAMIGSSSASTAMVLALAETSALPLPAAIALVLGNNIGTCITAVLAGIGGSRDVQRVAAAHVLLNVAGAAVFLGILHPFALLVQTVAHSPGGQVAVAHFLYNAICSLAALPFARAIARALTRWLPERKTERKE